MEVDHTNDADDANENSMDWTPLPPLSSLPVAPSSPSPFASSSSPSISFAKQRFVPPDLRKPTGLEGMFSRVGLREDAERGGEGEGGARAGGDGDTKMEEAGRRGGWLSGFWGGGK